MDPTLNALAAALALDLAPLKERLEAANAGDGDLLDALPALLTASILGIRTATVLRATMATAYMEGVAAVHSNLPKGGQLLNPAKAFALVNDAGVLKHAVNPVSAMEQAVRERAEGVAAVLKAQVVQSVKVELQDPEAEDAVESALEVLDTLKDSDHVQLAARLTQESANGYGAFSVQQTDEFLRRVPFQEFYRVEERIEWREWPKRWAEQGGTFHGAPSDYPEGRMIAETNSNIWQDISAFGDPYPPFDYNSGMGVKPVSAEDVAKMGLRIPKRQHPKRLSFNAGLTFSADFDPEIVSALADSLSAWNLNEDRLEKRP